MRTMFLLFPVIKNTNKAVTGRNVCCQFVCFLLIVCTTNNCLVTGFAISEKTSHDCWRARGQECSAPGNSVHVQINPSFSQKLRWQGRRADEGPNTFCGHVLQTENHKVVDQSNDAIRIMPKVKLRRFRFWLSNVSINSGHEERLSHRWSQSALDLNKDEDVLILSISWYGHMTSLLAFLQHI